LLGSSSSSDDDVFYEMALKEHSRGAEIVSIVDIRVVLLAGLHACGLRRGFSVFSLKIEPILSRRWQREDLGMEHELPLAQQVATPNLVAHYMSRIWNLNPLVNAVVEACAPEEEEEAAEQDSFTEDQIISKAFFGLPFVVKDSLDVLGFHTTCGASVYEHNAPADGDCKLVALLKKLRAIPIGKTNVPFVKIS
jgi:hypothetical protein